MTSRLDLTKALARWSGTELPSKVTSTTSPPTDHVADLVAFVDQAWLDIQVAQKRRWLWMRTRIDDTALSALTALNRVKTMDSFIDSGREVSRILPFYDPDLYPSRYILIKHPTTDAINKCEYIPYAFFRGYFDRGDRQENRPTRFTIRPNGDLEFDPTPDVAYTLNCDAVYETLALTADGDEPDMPADFHMLIVWWAMVHLMDFDENTNRYKTANRQYTRLYNRLCIEQLLEVGHGEFMSHGEVSSW